MVLWRLLKLVHFSCQMTFQRIIAIFSKFLNVSQFSKPRIKLKKIKQNYRTADEQRAMEVQKHMTLYGQIEQDVGPIVNKCLETIKDNASAIDPEVVGFVYLLFTKVKF